MIYANRFYKKIIEIIMSEDTFEFVCRGVGLAIGIRIGVWLC